MAPARTEPSDHLNRDDLGEDLVGTATRGAAVTISTQGLRFVIQTGSTMILARLLSPADFGLIAMVVALTGFADLMIGFGLSAATVQRARVTDDQISVLFWVNALLGVIVAVIVAVLSPVIAAFYDQPELTAITLAMSTNFLLAGLTTQHEALILRRMRYGRLAVVDIGSMAVGAAVGVIAAWQGAGVWALVLLAVAQQLTRLVLVWQATPWRPGRPRRGTGVRSMVTFGANLSVFSILNYASRNLDNVLIGRQWGAAQLGIYAKAYQLLMFPIQQINQPIARVAIPTLSLLQDDDERFVRYYRAAIVSLSFVCMPLIVMMAVLSDEIVLVTLGHDWLEAAPIFRVLAFAGIAQTVSFANGWIYVSTGHTGRQAVWALVSRPLVVLSFVIGLPWGPYGVAVSYTVASYILLIPAFAWAVKGTPLSLRMIVGAVWRPVAISAAMYVGASKVHEITNEGGRLASTVAAIVAGMLVFGAALRIIPGAWGQLSQVLLVVRKGLVRGSGDPEILSTDSDEGSRDG